MKENLVFSGQALTENQVSSLIFNNFCYPNFFASVCQIVTLNSYNIFKLYECMYRPFHKTSPRSSAFVYWISVRFLKQNVCKKYNCTTRFDSCVFLQGGCKGLEWENESDSKFWYAYCLFVPPFSNYVCVASTFAAK